MRRKPCKPPQLRRRRLRYESSFPMQSITVIVACYNGAATLARALDSCLGQPEATRILVVDDGSTDASASIARVYALRDSRIRLLQTGSKGGAASARNWAALSATTPLIAFLGSADEYLPGALAAARSHLERHPQEAAIRLDVELAGFPRHLTSHPKFDHYAAVLSNTVPSSLVMRRCVFLALGGFPADETFRRHGGEDGALAWALQEIFGQRRLVDAKRVRMHYREGTQAERFLNIQLGFVAQDAAVRGETVRCAKAFLDGAVANMAQLRALGEVSQVAG
jgi:glycosyltransferase involved in cell wall biosynthesis